MLELKNITVERDNKLILNNINLKINDSKCIVITGPNGSGKSTLAKIIMGLENPDFGEIYLDETNITDWSIDKRANSGISYSFQQPVKFKGITVNDLIRLSSNKYLTESDVCNILSKVGLCAKDYTDREVNDSLSGGELKRIEIASVSTRNTKVMIFDEPEAGIDLWSFNNLVNIFKDLCKEENRIMIIISHQEKILDIADEVILLKDGNIEMIGNKNDIIPLTSCIKSCPVLGGTNE